ncbi:translocation/assembly module TamB domain-containing protein [Sandaracinus amylolyticus]|uniref:translocation/assembly module TamB domain-containing protein n=1 Tax=Sandaracinus amylolyticus TaxID=927083 RepID=UPI001F022790|nr:translocation/assembly module TamB domain-containing protein [Sandaracinus amylolyticus]UJR79986.1 Hypothetical protein I5071_20290 [Sandaracinus amylolyticus]
MTEASSNAPPQRSLFVRALRRAPLVLLRGLGWTLVLVLCLIVSAALHSLTGRMRLVARELIERLASGALRGDLEVGRIEQLDTDRIIARDVVLRDPQGRAVIRVDRLQIWPNYREILFGGRIHFLAARADHVEIELYVSGAEGETVSLLEAFEPASPGPDRGGPASAIPIVLDGLHVVDADIRGDLPNYENLHVEGAEARGRLEIARTVVVNVHHLEGRMTGPYGGVTQVEHATLDLDTDWRVGMRAYMRARRGEDTARARLSLTRPDAPDPTLPGPQDAPMHMDLEVHVDQLGLETLHEMGIPGTEQLAGRMRGDARMQGPVEDLRFDAWITHDAGPLTVHGRIATEQDFEVDLETYDFDLQELVPAAPPIAIGGTMRLDVARDPEAPQRARFRVTARPLEVAGIFVPAFESEGAIEADAVVIDRVEAPHLGGVIEGRGRVGFDGSLDVHARIDVEDLGGDPNVADFVPGLHGAAEGTLDVESGPGGTDLALTTQLRLRGFRYRTVRAGSLVVRGRARGELARPIAHFDVDGQGVAIAGRDLGTVDARIDGGPSEYVLQWSSRGRDVRALDVDARVHRHGDRWEIHVPDAALDVGLGPMRGAIGTVRIDPGAVSIQGAEIEGSGQRLAGEARIATGGGPSTASVDVAGLDLERVGALVGGGLESLRGTASGHLELEGPLRDPDVTLRGRVEDLSWDRVRNADIAYDLGYSDGVLTTNVQGDFGTRGTLGVEGPIAVPFAALTDPDRFAREAEFGLNVYAGHLNLAFLTPFLGEQLQALGITGRIGGDVRIGGTVAEPRIDPGVIILDRFALPGWSELRAKIHLALVGDQLTVQRVWLADTTGELAMAEAQIPISMDDPPADLPAFLRTLSQQPWSFAARIAPRLLSSWPRPLQRRVPEGVVGALALSAAGGDGQPARAEITGTMEWVEAPLEDPCARDLRPIVQLQGTLHEGTTRVDLSGFSQGRMIAFGRAEAETPLDDWLANGAFTLPHPDLLVQLLDMPLEHVPWTCGRASGVATAEVIVQDVLGDSPQLDARLEITQLRVAHGDDGGQGTMPYHVLAAARVGGTSEEERAEACAIIAAQGQLTTPFAECSSTELPEDTEVVLRGSVPLRFSIGSFIPEVLLDRDLDLTMLMADAHLEPVLALIPQIAESDVIADGRLIASGPWETLEVAGGVSLREGRVRVVPLGQHLVDVHGALRFAGDRVTIPAGEALFARDGEGTVEVSGEIGLRGLIPTYAYLDVQPDQFPVRREGAVLATISGRGDTRVTIESDGLEGTVTTEGLTIRLPEQMAGSVQSLEEHPDILVIGTQARELGMDEGPGYPVHLYVDASDPFWVRRNDFAVQVSAQLDVRYLDPNLYVGGIANLERGYFEVFGKRFEVQGGSLVFGGTEELDPQVDLVAVYELPGGGGATITVTAGGTLSNLSIDFSSTETSDQGEIIALLVSGRRTLGEDSGAQTQAATEQAARVVTGIAAGILTLGLREQFGDAFPLIAIETGANLGDTRIRAGFNADAIIPDAIRDVVLGAYVEGFVTTSAGNQAGGGTGGVGGGVNIELQFPFDLVGSGTYVPPTSWGLDLVWEP